MLRLLCRPFLHAAVAGAVACGPVGPVTAGEVAAKIFLQQLENRGIEADVVLAPGEREGHRGR